MFLIHYSRGYSRISKNCGETLGKLALNYVQQVIKETFSLAVGNIRILLAWKFFPVDTFYHGISWLCGPKYCLGFYLRELLQKLGFI